MVLLKIVLVLAAVTGLMILGFYLWAKIYDFWLNRVHPDYHRTLNSIEKKYLESSGPALRDFAKKQRAPKFYNTVYIFGFLPVMAFVWALIYGLWYIASKAYHQPLTDMRDTGAILFFQNEVGPSAVIAVFAGILVAGYLLYWLTGKSKAFTIWMALTGSSSRTETPQSILTRRVDGIEHKLRLGVLSTSRPFSPIDYLLSVISGHKSIFAYLSLVMLVPTLIFGVMDVRNTAVFYPDRIEYTNYWDGDKTGLRYDEIARVRIECWVGSKGKVSTTLEYETDEKISYRLSDWRRRLVGVLKLDAILRGKVISFETEQSNPNCFARYLANAHEDNRAELRKVLHIGD